MNDYEILGRTTTELALIQRGIKNGLAVIAKNASNTMTRLGAEAHYREYGNLGELERRVTELKSIKIKLLNKCKKEFKEHVINNNPTNRQG